MNNGDNSFNSLRDLSHLSSLDITKSAGSDGLFARFLRVVSDVMLYNESLCTGIISLDWKRSRLTPVYKRSEDAPGNYQPIPVVSVIVRK